MVKQLKDVQIQSDTERLVLLIRQLGLTQKEFAKELQYSPSYFESVINGREPWSEPFMDRINQYLARRKR